MPKHPKAAKAPETDSEPLASPAGRAWLESQLAAAELEVARGPKCLGWKSNETLRAPIEAHAAFLRALLEKLSVES